MPLLPHIRSGYLKTGKTIEDLALACGIDPHGLRATIDDYNSHARKGDDPVFGRGTTAYNRKQGDPRHQSNPCVAPIERGPFYAETAARQLCHICRPQNKRNAQVLDGRCNPISGLYAVGRDMASIMGGFYPVGMPVHIPMPERGSAARSSMGAGRQLRTRQIPQKARSALKRSRTATNAPLTSWSARKFV